MFLSRIVVPRRLANGKVVIGNWREVEVWMPKHRVGARVGRSMWRGRRCDQRDADIPREQRSHEVVDMLLQAAISMDRIDRARHDGNPQALPLTLAHSVSGAG